MLKNNFFRILIFPLFLLVIPIQGASQDNELDSLLNVLEDITKEDTASVMQLNKIAVSYWNKNPIITELFSSEALEISQKIDYKVGIAKSYRVLGVSQWAMGNYEKAMDAHFKSLELYIQLGDSSGIAASNVNIAGVFTEQENWKEADFITSRFRLENYTFMQND